MIMNKKDMENKWFKEYIENIDTSEIEWLVLDSGELKKFFADNYYDEKCDSYVKEICDIPIEIPVGMFYLAFNYIDDDFKYLLGVVSNNVGKKTIVACLMYLDECFLFEGQHNPVTYILSVEVNCHFRNKGIFKKMVEEFIGVIDANQHLVVSKQSGLGKICKVFKTIDTIAKSSSFEKEVLYNDFMGNEVLRKIVCDTDYSYIKK